MLAELAALEPGPARRRFAWGCARAVLTASVTASRLGYAVLVAGALTGAVVLTDRVPYGPLHSGLIGLVAVLVVLSFVGRRPGLGPVAGAPVARAVRAAGYLLVGGTALSLVFGLREGGDPVDRAGAVFPFLTVTLSVYLVGFLVATRADRPVAIRALGIGFAAGLGATVLWLGAVLVTPPVPPTAGPALLAMVLAATVAGVASRSVLAAALAGTVTALGIWLLVSVLASLGPARLIPELAPHALTPADRLANSRIELVDPYVAVLLLGCLVAVALSLSAFATARTPRSHVRFDTGTS
jgi:hypothetical protein